jgi:phage tail-like protein
MPEGVSDPISAFAFELSIDSLGTALFREASGFGSENQIIEFKQQGEKGQTHIHKIPGTLKWQNIVLKRGITDGMDLWDWRQKVIEGNVEEARTAGTISAYDENGDLKIQYTFTRGWPSKWEASGLNASGNDPIVETLEITHEGLERKKV